MRIVAISDLHGQFPKGRIPECDLLIVAGDVCPDIFEKRLKARTEPDRQLRWFENVFVPWVDEQPCTWAISTWGNHDFCGHLQPNADYGKLAVRSDAGIQFGDVKVWLTPWSNQFMDWAWMQPHADLAKVYGQIPGDIDILVSHQPPYGFGDVYPNFESGKMEHIGSSELLYTIERVRPSIVVCGHLHGGHGTYNLNGETDIYNVSILNEGYQLYYPVTEIEYAEGV